MRSAARVSTACSQSARFQKEEAVADAFEKVGLVLDEADGLGRRPETGVAGDRPTDVPPVGEGGVPGGTTTGSGGRVSSPDEDTQRGGESPRGSDTRTGPSGDSIPGGGVIRPVRRNGRRHGRFHRITDQEIFLGFGSPEERGQLHVRAITHYIELAAGWRKSSEFNSSRDDGGS